MFRTTTIINRPLVPTIGAVFALVSLATGCGKTGSSDASSDVAGGSAPEEFGLSLAQLTTRIEDTERLIATCMSDAGFGYVALDFASVKQAMDSDQTVAGVSDEDYVKQYGLGITTQFDKPLIVFGAGPTNNTYVDGLPESDQVAFHRALWGETPDWNHTRALEEEDFSETGGCTRSAAQQTYTATELGGTYVNPGDQLVDQDPRMIAALKQWSECMRADGYEYDLPDQIDDDLRDRLDAITEGQDPATLTGPSLAALVELQGEELAIAAVYLTCEEDIIEPVQAKVEAELYGSSPT